MGEDTMTARYHVIINGQVAEDDGAIAGPWLTTADSPWAPNEGPCPCGGILRWAEAGYTPWHRICDRCGSHWTMRQIVLFIDRETRTVRDRAPENTPEQARMARLLRAMIRPEHITDEAVRHGAIYGRWARRARFV